MALFYQHPACFVVILPILTAPVKTSHEGWKISQISTVTKIVSSFDWNKNDELSLDSY